MDGGPRRGAAGGVAGNLLLALGSLLFTLLLAELVLGGLSRIYYPRLTVSDPVLGWKYKPTPLTVARVEGGERNRLEINPDGFRDDEFELADDALRIMVLGDSFTFGAEVDQEEIFPRLVEQRLRRQRPERRIDVMNFGITGFSTAQELLCLRQYAPRYPPRAVLLMMLERNDWDGNLAIFAGGRFVPHFVLDGDRLVLHDRPSPAQRAATLLRDRSVLFYLLTNRVPGVRARLERHHRVSEEEIREVTFGILAEIARFTRERQIRLLIFYLRDPGSPGDRWAALRRRAARQGWDLTMIPLVPEERVGGRGHWNAAGHRAAAEIVHRELTRRAEATLAGAAAPPAGPAG